MARLHAGFLLLVAWALALGQLHGGAAERGRPRFSPRGRDGFAAPADFGLGRVGRALAQISAQEAVERSKQGKALFPTLNGGSTNEEDVAQTEADAKQAFSLDSLGDPMGLLSCVPSCDAGSTCALVSTPACTPDPNDNTGEGCSGQAPPGPPTWVCQPCKEGEYCPMNSLYITNEGGRLDALRKSPDPLNTSSICPAGAICPDAATIMDCPPGRFCPMGSTTSLTCSIPDLLNYNYSAEILVKHNMLAVALGTPFLGNFCPTNSSSPGAACPPGYYCPNPAEAIKCPKDHFCVGGSSAPKRCATLSNCPEGSATPATYIFGLLIAVVGVLAYFLVTYILDALRMYMRRTEQAKQTLYSQLFTVLNAQLDEKDQSDVRGLPPPDELIHLSFDRLTFTLPNGQVALEGVTGEIPHSRLVAVMGPSGSGKSTFMNALAGRAPYGKIGGTVQVNGEVANMKHFRSNIGFVPQDDIVYDDLTVRENLAYSAHLRQPPGTPKQKIDRVVARVIRALQLGPVQNSLVGNVERRGISGGQRKRVNVGIELVATPALLFLDEPTSGLDATASWDIIYALKCLAQLGVTIITVIHQPRFSIFNMFDDLLLLGRGGLTVYLGPCWLAEPYFNHLGWELPDGENPADFLLDIIAGNEINPKDARLTNTALPAEWERNVAEGWVEDAQETLDAPAQNFSKPRPAEMCTDAVDERRLTTLVVFILSEARRRRAIGALDDESDNPSTPHAVDDRPSSPSRKTATRSKGRVGPDSIMTVAELRDMMNVFALDPSDMSLDRILLRAGLAFRKGEDSVKVSQMIRFLVADYQVQISSLRNTNRKMLNRQRTALNRSIRKLNSRRRFSEGGVALTREFSGAGEDDKVNTVSWLLGRLVRSDSQEHEGQEELSGVLPDEERRSQWHDGLSVIEESISGSVSPSPNTSIHRRHSSRNVFSIPDAVDEAYSDAQDFIMDPLEETNAPTQNGASSIFSQASEYGSPRSRPSSPYDEFSDAGEHPGILMGADPAGSVRADGDASESADRPIKPSTVSGISRDAATPGETGPAGRVRPVEAANYSADHTSNPSAISGVPRDAATAPVDRFLGRRDSRPGGPGGGWARPGDPPTLDGNPGGGAHSLTRRLSTLGKAGVQLNADDVATRGDSAGGDDGARDAGSAFGRGPLRALHAVHAFRGQAASNSDDVRLPPSPFAASAALPPRNGRAALPLSPFADASSAPAAISVGDSAFDAGGAGARAAAPPGRTRQMPSKSPFEMVAEVGWNPPSRQRPEPVFPPKYHSCPANKVVKFAESGSYGDSDMLKRQSSCHPEQPCEGLDEPRLKESTYSLVIRGVTSGLHWVVLPVVAGTTGWDRLIGRIRKSKGTGRMPPGTLQQMWYVILRSFVQWTRHMDEVFIDNLLCILVAYILGLLLVDSLDFQSLPLTALTTMLAFALLSASGSLKVFSRHRTVFARETWTGLRPLPYFLARIFVDLINVAMRPFLFTLTIATAFQAKASFRGYYITTLMVSWWTSTLGYAISIYFSNPAQALMIHIIAILIFGILIAGVNSPNLANMYATMRWVYYLSGLSYNRWATEAITVHDYGAWNAHHQHLGLTRMLQIGFCGNQKYGMPSLETLSEVFTNASGIQSFNEGLEAARPRLGSPVVDTLTCTFDTGVTMQRRVNCVQQICGGRIAFDWLVLFGVGCCFCFLGYLGISHWFIDMWNKIIFGLISVVEVGILGWLRPLLLWLKDKVKAGLLRMCEACMGERHAPNFLRPSMDAATLRSNSTRFRVNLGRMLPKSVPYKKVFERMQKPSKMRQPEVVVQDVPSP